MGGNQVRSEQMKEQNARIQLDRIQEEMRLFEQYTRRRTQLELEAKLEAARNDLIRVQAQARAKQIQANVVRLTKRRIHNRRKQRLADIENEIKKCHLYAPCSGMVIYAMSAQSRSGRGALDSIIAQGEPVREGQVLMRIPDLSNFQVRAMLPEALVSQVRGEEWESSGLGEAIEASLMTIPDLPTRFLARTAFAELRPRFQKLDRRLAHPGHRATIWVEAYPEVQLAGHVKWIAAFASDQDVGSTELMVYRTRIAIDDSLEGLRPDMSAEATIYLDDGRGDVLLLPRDAIVHSLADGDRCRCFVKTPVGIEERVVEIGEHDAVMVEARSGLSEGEEVILNP
jgi:multidrug efflux pump subunit AcrA (membrane-fusion protein)